ncbi:MAG TPA: metallophosphoesterase [Actinomycetota bacterium]|nr:metallophosphoesterase [Actinomycetota bacterium]
MRRALALLLVLTLAGCAGSNDDGPDDALSGVEGTASPTASDLPTPSTSPTEPVPPKKRLRFAAIGDFGAGNATQQAIADRMCRWRERRSFDLVVTVGDNVYDVGHPDRFDEAFFRPYDCLLDAGVRFHATLGNHDIITDNGRPELEEPAFGFVNERRNYVFRQDGVRFVMADSNNMRFDWLRSALRTQPGDRWTVVAFHHPVYATGSYGPTPGFTPRLPRMFRRKGVDLVLNGHEHQYSVTEELRGIRYAVTGGGGASIRPCGEPAWFTNVCLERFHFLEVLATQEQIEVRAIGPRGRPFHRFTTDGRD